MKLVPKNTVLYKRITHTYHCLHEYGSPNGIAAKIIRDGYYCPGLVKRLQVIQNKCGKCRRERMKVDPPEMGALGLKRLIPSKPFTYCQMDLAGPVFVKGFVHQRQKRKAWILVGICDYTRMISLTMVESLSKEHLLAAIKSHFSRYGKSKRIESDLGTNFVATKKILEDENSVNDGDLKHLTEELKSEGCSMIQRCARSPFIQGSAEHAVKLTKKALKQYKSSLTTFNWINLLEKTMNILNLRPIGAKTTGEILCPADIHSFSTGVNDTIEANIHEGNTSAYYKQTLDLLEDFKKQWFKLYYKTLIQQRKWIDKNNVLEPEDLVLVIDHQSNYGHGYPTLARIVHVDQDNNGIDRYFSCQYRTERGTLKTLKRTPQSLCLVLKKQEDHCVDKFDIQNVESEDEDDVPSTQPDINEPDTQEVPGASDETPVDEPTDNVGTVNPKPQTKMKVKVQMQGQEKIKDLPTI